jgi:hypothetical protein
MNICNGLLILLLSAFTIADTSDKNKKKIIDIYPENPAYWMYGGKPVLLMGGSDDDNLFQHPRLKQQLELLKSVGGNYIRNTMSGRNDMGWEVHAFHKLPNGKYDLNQWNPDYWSRFENMLKWTSERDIIVQIEVWATFDYYREHWAAHPFNPKNNVNYTVEQTGLPIEVNSHPTRTENNFFWSVPKERNQQTVLHYQQKFVDKMLSYTLLYGNVLYCMDNETSVTPEWGYYWSDYIKTRAKEAGIKVHTTEMWDRWDLSDRQHNPSFDHPEIYSFLDISQNNHQTGQKHWDNAQLQRNRISSNIRPLNNVKIYGADTGSFGTDRDGQERFWRNIFGGMASSRFHRPNSGLGLGTTAQANIKSMRALTDRMDIFHCQPHNDLLSERQDNEAFCIASPSKEYAVYFPDGGQVKLNLGKPRKATLRWLDIVQSEWKEPLECPEDSVITLQCPEKGFWAVLVQ